VEFAIQNKDETSMSKVDKIVDGPYRLEIQAFPKDKTREPWCQTLQIPTNHVRHGGGIEVNTSNQILSMIVGFHRWLCEYVDQIQSLSEKANKNEN